MVNAKSRLVSLAVLAGVALSGCDVSQKDPDFPASIAPTTFNALFVDTNNIPWPTDFFFLVAAGSGKVDGTPTIPSPLNAPPFTYQGAALDGQDGWSTTAFTSTAFNFPLDPTSISGSSVKIVEMYLDNVTKTPATTLPPGVTSPVIRTLTAGTDFKAEVSPDTDSGGKILRITPLKPLRPSAGLINIGYVVLVTNGIKDTSGNSAQPSALYSAIKASPVTCTNFTDATQKAWCLGTRWHLNIAPAAGVNPADVVVSWSYTTQSVEDTFKYIATAVPGTTIAVQATGLTTKQVSPALEGKANIYVGTTTVPYYLSKPANTKDRVVLTNVWRAAGPPPVPGFDQASRNVTRFNPVPAKTTDVTIPVLVTVPNATAAGGGCSKPTAGWPVVIFQHGLGGDRTNALFIADNYADACFIVAAIDQPLHGVTSTTNPFYQKDNERTFNLDLVDNATGFATAPSPTNTNYPGDGIIDASATHWVNILSAGTQRDNLRQGEADLIVFTKTIAKLDITGDGVADVDPKRINYSGMSLGGIVGGVHVHFSNDMQTAALSVPGGVLAALYVDSPYFGPRVRALIGAPTTFNGQPLGYAIPDGSTLFNNLMRDFQTAVDSGDPVNHIADAQANVPLFLQRVNGDTTIPNSSTNTLITAGKLKKVSTLGPTAVGEGSGAWVALTAGSHSSLLDPSSSAAATVEMRTQFVKFAASAAQPGGPFLFITNPAVIEK
jgi:hypothetical protein